MNKVAAAIGKKNWDVKPLLAKNGFGIFFGKSVEMTLK